MEQSILDFLNEPIQPVNVGVADFGQMLEEQVVTVVYVDWLSPATGDQGMIDLLDQLLKKDKKSLSNTYKVPPVVQYFRLPGELSLIF